MNLLHQSVVRLALYQQQQQCLLTRQLSLHPETVLFPASADASSL